jgi:hypothetical protein
VRSGLAECTHGGIHRRGLGIRARGGAGWAGERGRIERGVCARGHVRGAGVALWIRLGWGLARVGLAIELAVRWLLWGVMTVLVGVVAAAVAVGSVEDPVLADGGLKANLATTSRAGRVNTCSQSVIIDTFPRCRFLS